MKLDFLNNIINNIKESDFVQNFMNELGEFLEQNNKIENNNVSQNEVPKNNNILTENNNLENINQTKYDKYWKYQNFIEDSVSKTIGLSRYANDVTYKNELADVTDESILKIAEKEGTLYRKQYPANGSINGNVFNIEKFENGKIEKLTIPANEIPVEYQNQDIIFQYIDNGKARVRMDIKDEIIDLASKKCEDLKVEETKKAQEFKKEGHIYKAFENDGYIFLSDTTKKAGDLLEDIDFVLNNYEGEGMYQVIEGEYKKID